MKPHERIVYQKIIDGFEQSRIDTMEKDNIPDSAAARAAFYHSCLIILREGGDLKYPAVQQALIKYYTRLWVEHRERLLDLGQGKVKP